MKPSINIFATIGAAALLLLPGCTKQELPAPADTMPESKDKQEIQFRFFVEEGDRIIPYEDYWNAVNLPQSGTTSRTARSNMPAEFTLYGVYNTVDVPDGTTDVVTSSEAAPENKRFFNGITVNGNGTYTGDRRYWVADGKTRHTFAAIAGLSTWATKLDEGFTENIFIPVVSERFDSDPKTQKDLLVAYGPANVIVDGVAPIVNIYFRHAISRLLFNVTSSGGAALYDCVLKIKYNSVHSRNKIYYTGDTYTPVYSHVWNVEHNINAPITIPTTATSEEDAIELGDMKIHAYSQKDKWLDLTLSYAKIPSGVKTTLKTTLPAVALQPGMQYNYYLYVSEITETLSISSIIVEPWTTEIRVADPLD